MATGGTIFYERALLPAGWTRDVRVDIAPDGRIAAIIAESEQPTGRAADGRVLLPAPGNVHSHAFQRAMAGLTQHRARPDDDFWSWRSLMYRFLDRLTPEQIEAIAAYLYVEMLEAGFAAVGEFHYVHHQPGGVAYADPAETGRRIAAAARASGIGLTHLPSLYAYAGADGRPLAGPQLRFGCDGERFARLVESTRIALNDAPADWRLGIAPHSLRAVSPDMLAEALPLAGGGPVHIHAAEQVKEVAEVEAALGARPVAWLLGNAPVGPTWCLIHATHMLPAETEGLARSGAVAGLCPLTEADLGDGLGEAAALLEAGGRIGIGSDSNVRISLGEELRSLEHGQRLKFRRRNVLATADRSTGRRLYEAALAGGAGALGRQSGAIEPGRWADLVAVDPHPLAIADAEGDRLLDGWLLSGDDRVVRDVWSAGRHVVADGRHVDREPIEREFRRALAELRDAI